MVVEEPGGKWKNFLNFNIKENIYIVGYSERNYKYGNL